MSNSGTSKNLELIWMDITSSTADMVGILDLNTTSYIVSLSRLTASYGSPIKVNISFSLATIFIGKSSVPSLYLFPLYSIVQLTFGERFEDS